MDNFYFYTESAFIHQGDVDYLLKLVEASKTAGAQGIKFQVLADYDAFISRSNPHYEPFKKTLIASENWLKVFERCKSLDLDIIYMPCDIQAATFANTLYKSFIKYLDIHPVNFLFDPILSLIKKSEIPVILGMGGRTEVEVTHKINYFGEQIKVLMFGHQAFPTQFYESAIHKIPLLKTKFPDISIGYADHSPFDSEWGRNLQSVAYLLGARFFEKHIALEAGVERFDYLTSCSQEQISDMIQDLRHLQEKSVEFNYLNTLNPAETKYTSRQLKAVTNNKLNAGDIIKPDDISYKLIESEIGIPYGINIIGKKIIHNTDFDCPILEVK